MNTSLHHLAPGQRGIVISVRDSSLTERLRDLGFTNGTPVACTMRSPLGDPCAYTVRGTVIVLRNRDAAAVEVDSVGEPAAIPQKRHSIREALHE